MALSTNTHILLIAFNATTEQFICKPKDIGQLVKDNGSQGVNFIKIYDPVKQKFVKVSKATVKNICGFHTESILALESKKY